MLSLFIYWIAYFASLFNTDWKTYKDFNGRFSVEIPCETMNETQQTIPTPIGNIDYHSFVCTPQDANAENKLYLVSYTEYPEGTIHPDSTDLIKTLYQETIQSATKSVNGTLTYETDINHKGVNGKFWRIDYNKGKAVMKSRAFIIKNRFYIIQVATIKARSRNVEADKFLDSLKWF